MIKTIRLCTFKINFSVGCETAIGGVTCCHEAQCEHVTMTVFMRLETCGWCVMLVSLLQGVPGALPERPAQLLLLQDSLLKLNDYKVGLPQFASVKVTKFNF